MSSWSAVEKALRQHRVSDVLVPGWIDREDDIPQFRPQPVVVYLCLDEGFLRLESTGSSDQLVVRVASAVELDGIELFEDVDDEVIVASCGEQLFGDGWEELRCTDVRYFTDSRSSADEGAIKCLFLELEGRYSLFFDPTWTFGIRVGNREDLLRWMKDQRTEGPPGGPGSAATSGAPAPPGITEHTW